MKHSPRVVRFAVLWMSFVLISLVTAHAGHGASAVSKTKSGSSGPSPINGGIIMREKEVKFANHQD